MFKEVILVWLRRARTESLQSLFAQPPTVSTGQGSVGWVYHLFSTILQLYMYTSGSVFLWSYYQY